MPHQSISILLATYNGEAYLREQLDSLFEQTNQDFVLYAQDDCSTDGTVAILKEYADRYPGRIHVTVNDINSGAAKHNFMHLLIAHPNDYAMFCDQDDVWLPDKIALTLQAMQQAEAQYGATTPLLVHTDLKVVDADLRTINPSLRRMERLRFHICKLRNLLIDNSVTGCTVMVNRALCNCVSEEPDFYFMHDWWLAMTAVSLGRIVSLERVTTVLYRQHGGNTVGAVQLYSPAYFKKRKERIEAYDFPHQARHDLCRQAAAFLAMYRSRLSRQDVAMLSAYAGMESLIKLKRIGIIFKYRIFRHGLLRIIAQLIGACR